MDLGLEGKGVVITGGASNIGRALTLGFAEEGARVLIAEAIYYLCGPRPFLRAFVGGLARHGIPLARIQYEFFGPADELLAA